MSNTTKDFGGNSHNGTLNPNYSSQSNGFEDDKNGPSAYIHDGSSDQALRRIRAAGSISISPEQFEKLFLSPQNKVKGDLRSTFANPTPLALLGFLLSLSPLSFDLMGLRGAGGSGAAGIGVYFFMGGLLMLLGAIGEFLLGNTFPFIVFGSFGGFWLSFGATLTPSFNAYGAYTTDPTKAYLGATQPGFYASFAYFQLFMGILCFIYLIAALRTNVVFVVIFLTLVIAFECLAGGYWQLAQGATAQGGKLFVVAGGFTFVTCLAGWYIFLAQVLASVDFPISIPVGDLSTMIKGASQKSAAKDD